MRLDAWRVWLRETVLVWLQLMQTVRVNRFCWLQVVSASREWGRARPHLNGRRHTVSPKHWWGGYQRDEWGARSLRKETLARPCHLDNAGWMLILLFKCSISALISNLKLSRSFCMVEIWVLSVDVEKNAQCCY